MEGNKAKTHTHTFTIVRYKWKSFCCLYPFYFHPDDADGVDDEYRGASNESMTIQINADCAWTLTPFDLMAHPNRVDQLGIVLWSVVMAPFSLPIPLAAICRHHLPLSASAGILFDSSIR